MNLNECTDSVSMDLYTVSVGSQVLGQFKPGETIDFVALLGYGVKEFQVTGINGNLDFADPRAFPIQLAFSNETASFRMRAIAKSQDVPEPNSPTTLLLLGVGAMMLVRTSKRRLKA
ncbi:hypothetical protein H6G20_24120 [Desertifilum sp. FACHB-1129]|nr:MULTISPECIES: hypothetical protein [unclassified Desertifilum]MBD2314759.1 hypothetical protein [Desertifilum sp. FACHB-1129]MBD2323918.1 hypothetical protein [Desertifilum sp. FACHB-866]MBD2333763.1 hypothetical protein [Desertifilum sp. FACHB-868]MDA0213263.1 hypothetical protein [Cyanobacteria bacterium FC1]